MFKLFLPSLLALLFFVNARSQEKLIYETGATLVDKARILLEQEEYDEAIKVYERIHPNDSLYANSFVTMSYYNLIQKKYDASLEVIEAGLKVATPVTKRGLYLNKGISYEGLASFDLAKEIYEEGLKEYPRSHKLRFNLSRMNEELGQKEEAFNNLILTLESNPFFEKAILRLGNMYREQDKRAQALLLYNLYLLFSPDGDSSFAVLQMANNMVEAIQDLDGDTRSITADDDLFESYNLILESQLALKKDFEITNDLNIPFAKQTFAFLKQLEKESFEGESRLWSELIIPFYKWINENNHYDNLTYTTAYSIKNDDLKKIVTKKTEDIKEFLPLAYSKWSELSSQDDTTVSGAKVNLKRNYIDGLLSGEGPVNGQGEPIGDWTYYNDAGQIIAKGKFKEGERDGNWEWYHDNGTIKEKGPYSKGLEQGAYEFYHDNGIKRLSVIFKKGQLDGPYSVYTTAGALQEKRFYKEGEMDGLRRFFYECDENLLFYEYPIKEGKAQGAYTEFYPNGQLSKTMTLVNDYAQGEENLYYYNGTLSGKATYNEGSYEGPFTTYFTTGAIETTGSYVNGKFNGEYKKFFSDGTLREKLQYESGKIEGTYLVYDRDGNLLTDFNYKNGLLREYTHFDKDGNVMVSEKKKSGELFYKGYDISRTIIAEGLYDIRGGKKGEWSYYNTYGALIEKGDYKENLIDGVYTLYHPNGEKKDISTYKEGVLQDYEAIYYPFGQLNSQSHYKDGLREGRMITYDPKGTIKADTYYHKGAFNGVQKYFDSNGILTSTAHYEFGVLMYETIYKKDGTILEKVDKFLPKDNSLVFHYENGQVKSSSTFKHGIFHGPHKEYDFYGNLEVEGTYVNDNLDGPVTSYHPDGTVRDKRRYVNGLLEGEYIDFYQNGKVEDSVSYTNGKRNGFSVYYNEKGIKNGELFYVDGELHGARKFYGEEKGALQLIRYYDHGKLIGYSYLDASNTEVPMIELPQGTGTVVSYFSNGSKGRVMTFKKGLNEGEYIAYYENGQIERKHVYVNDEIHGIGFSYYPDGTLKGETTYFHGYKDGLEKLFYENGTLKEENNYANGLRDGERHYYDENGKKTKTEVYFNENIIKSQSF